MRLGLLADIHEQNQLLRRALEDFRRHGVDRVVVLGDLLELGERIEETCRLLARVGAVGVWGNHDYGLACDPDVRTRAAYPASVIDFMTGLRPRVEAEECLFTHVEPWLDPEKIEDLWYFDGPPNTREKAARSFEANPHQVMFTGHFHCWLASTPEGPLDWKGTARLPLRPDQRYLITIAAACNGSYAVFDTNTQTLIPITP